MPIAFINSGDFPTYLGVRLLHAGNNGASIARGAHLRILQREGLPLESPPGNRVVNRIIATDRPADGGPAAVVVFAIKLQAEPAAAGILPFSGEQTSTATLQNRVDSAGAAARFLPRSQAFGAAA